MLVFFTNVSCIYGISGQIFDLISSFLSNRQLQVVLYGKSSHHKNIQLMLEFLKASFFLGPTLFLLYINGLPDAVIFDSCCYLCR